MNHILKSVKIYLNIKVLTSFSGILFDILPAIERQDEETQQIAKLFIEFFEEKIDLPTLQARLARFSQ